VAAPVGVRDGGGSRAAFSTLPVHGDPLTYAQPGRPDYADRCTPEYERIVAKMGSVLPYARARTLLEEFLPLDEVPTDPFESALGWSSRA
jgi:hypothetical protein